MSTVSATSPRYEPGWVQQVSARFLVEGSIGQARCSPIKVKRLLTCSAGSLMREYTAPSSP